MTLDDAKWALEDLTFGDPLTSERIAAIQAILERNRKLEELLTKTHATISELGKAL